MRKQHTRFVLRTTLIYAAVAVLWITSSDWLLMRLVQDRSAQTSVAIFKGWSFVAVTAVLLYGLLRRGMQRLERDADAQARTQTELRRWADAFAHCAHGLAIGLPGTDRVLVCNPAFAHMLGRTVAETNELPILDLYVPADREHVRQSMVEADRVGRVQFDGRMLRKEGSSFPVQLDLVSVRGSHGEILYRVATVQDITERKRAEALAREGEERLRTIVENLTEGLLIATIEGQYLLWNRAFLQLHGLEDNAQNRTVLPDFREMFELATLDDRVLALMERPLERVLRGETLQDVELAVRRIGTERVSVFSFSGSAVRDAAGRPHALLTVTDVTERRRALAGLRESEQRFRAVVENIHEVFWITDVAKNHLRYISPAYEAIWGRKREAIMDQPASVWLDTVHPDDRERVREAVYAKQVAGTFDEQYRVVRPDGTVRWVRDQAFPAHDACGRVERIVGIAQDITDRKQLEAQFLRAQRMEAIGTLAGGIAHDLNNILAPMLMAAGLLKEKVTDEHDREMLGMVERSARRGAEIIRQLLTFSRGVEGAHMALQPRHLVKEIGGIVRETFPRDIEFVDTTPADLWPVVADATQLHQVLVNLCVNARDAMPHGGKLTISGVNVELSEENVRMEQGARPGRYVAISVTDTGTGMPPELIDRIFDPFFTTKDLGKGTGLGLSTVLGIVRSHRGFITVTSEEGQGSSFQVHLPAASTEPDEHSAPSVEPLPVGRDELILVVDDEEPIRDSTRQLLENQNYRVLTASDGKEAVTAFLRERDTIQLVLTDVMMPQMGGAALIRALRLVSPQLKVVAISGLEAERNEELIAIGVMEILPKPCGPKALLDAIRRALHPDQ